MRLFVAVNLPPSEREAVYRVTEPLRGAGLPLRHSAMDGLHLTLKFLGQVSEDVAQRLGPALASAVREVRGFDLALGGFGAFPEAERPRVVWLGAERHPALELLANDVQLVASKHGFEPELRPFAPHVTLARARKDARPAELRGLGPLLERLSYQSVMAVESVDLMQSVPGEGGSRYHLLHRAALAAGV